MPSNDSICSSSSGRYVDIDTADVETETGREQDANRPPGSDYETAIHHAGVGKFQKVLLAVCGFIYATCAISSTTLSFVLPSAECDFQLTSADKGRLTATPLFGMLCGCCVWGSLANSKGRKTAIVVSLSMDFFAAVASAFTANYYAFVVYRFFNGFGIIGATSLIFSYLGEFLSAQRRDHFLGKLEIFWNVGVIVLPAVAWSILNKKSVQILATGGDFSPWRLFLFVCSLPSLISAILICFLPETPKFLMAKRQYRQARSVFQQIYACNSSMPAEHFPVLSLRGENNNNNTNKETRSDTSDVKLTTRNKLYGCWSVLRRLVNQQYFKYLIVTCLADFGLMASYYTLIMWFPEIFDRFSLYEAQHPHQPVKVCQVSRVNATSDRSTSALCDPSIETRVFVDTLIVGFSCIPTSASLSYFMYKCGKKSVLVFGLVLSGVATLALNWVRTSLETLVLSCVFEALTSVMEAVLFCVVVDLFPTNLRAPALTLTATCGRLGAIFGNLIFGALLDLNCAIPIYLFGILLIGSGLLCVAVPKNEEYITIY